MYLRLGKSPLVIMDDVDIDEAVEVAHAAIFANRKFYIPLFLHNCHADLNFTICHISANFQMANAAAPVAAPLCTRRFMMVKQFSDISFIWIEFFQI